MKTLKTLTLSIIALLIVTTATYALSTLEPQGTPGEQTHYTLNDIYNKIANFDTYTAPGPDGLISVPGTVAASFRSLTEVYELLANQDDLLPENIAQGATILGVEGTLSTEPAELEWSQEAPAQLCWDANQGCSEGSGLLNGEGAVEYCANLDDENSNTAWRLPTIEEYQSITDFTMHDNATQVSGFAQFSNYWSSTPYAVLPDFAWYWYSYDGYAFDGNMNNSYSVRCVR